MNLLKTPWCSVPSVVRDFVVRFSQFATLPVQRQERTANDERRTTGSHNIPTSQTGRRNPGSPPTAPNLLTEKYFTGKSLFLKDLAKIVS